MNGLFNRLGKIVTSNRHLRLGVPFLVLLLGSSYALSFLGRARYDYRKVSEAALSDFEKYGILTKNSEKKPLEEVHEELMEKVFKEDYSMVRGPRPWEPETLKQFPKDRVQAKNPEKL